MKEEQITKWEEKAKQGILYHDRTLQKIILEMRSAISTQIELDNGEKTSAYSIGLSTTGLKGQLTLNEDKLRTALSEDSDAVYNVFAKLDVNHMDDSDKMGIAQRLGDVFTNATKTIKSRAGSSSDVTEDSDLNNLLRNLQTKMSNFKKMMNAFEDALYKKYDKMESALARLGTQMNYVMGSSSQ
jgi:flagellar hook-associated protein 2